MYRRCEGGADHDAFSWPGQSTLEEKALGHGIHQFAMVASTAGRRTTSSAICSRPDGAFVRHETAVSTTIEEAVKLTYTPQIHSDDSVTAQLVAEGVPVFVPEMKAHRIATRQARTVVRLRDGEPLVIGGLIRREEVEHFRKVPILASLPKAEIVSLSL